MDETNIVYSLTGIACLLIVATMTIVVNLQSIRAVLIAQYQDSPRLHFDYSNKWRIVAWALFLSGCGFIALGALA